MDVVSRNEVKSFITEDGSEIRELLAHRNSGIRNQSLAEAILAPGKATTEHYHPKAEEIYYILQGKGKIRIGDETRELMSQDAVAIRPGDHHKIWNTGDEDLVFLCCCAPGYEHDDTVLTEGARG